MPKILVAEDNKEMRETLEQLFRFYKFSVIAAENGKVAVQKSKKENPDIILLDAHMPVMDGFDACKKIKSNKKTKSIPVVFLSAKFIEADNKIAGFELGADDYLLKPFNSKELVTRINAILQKNKVLNDLLKQNEELSLSNISVNHKLKILEEAQEEGPQNAMIDSLTGLYKNAYFLLRLKEEFNRSIRFNIYLTVILIEVKNYKQIIQDYGVQIGDYILMKMANVILNNTRVVDISARFKNGKFRILLPQTDAEGGLIESKRLKDSIESQNYSNKHLANVKKINSKRKINLEKLSVNIAQGTFPTDKKIQSEKDFLNLIKNKLIKDKPVS